MFAFHVIQWSGLIQAVVSFALGVGMSVAVAAPAEIVLQRGAQVEVLSAACSPDGRLIAASGESDAIRLWDRETGELIRTLPGHPERVIDVRFSPDGNLLASAGTDGSVKVWNYREGSLVHLWTNHVGDWVRRLAFSPDSRHLVPASYDRRASIWDLASGAVVRTLPTKRRLGDVRYTPDGRFIVTAAREDGFPTIQFWDTTTGEPGLSLLHTNSVSGLAISQDGHLLASGDEGGDVNLWELPSGRWLRRLEPREKKHTPSLNFSPDGRWLAVSGVLANSIIETATGKLQSVLRGHDDGTIQIAFSPDGEEVVSASADASVRLWDPRSGKVRRVIAVRPRDTPVTSIAFSPDGALEAVGSVDGVVRVWDGRNGSFKFELRGHEGAVHALTFSLDGQWLFSGGADRLMKVWDMSRGSISAHHPYFDRADAIGAIACGGREQYIASAVGPWGSAGLDRSIKIWQSHFDRPIRVLSGHATSVRALAYAPGVDAIASVGGDGVVKLWNSRTTECLRSLTNEVLIHTIAYAPDAKSLVVGLADGRVRVLDSGTLATTLEWQAHRRPVQSLALSAEGRWIATGSADQTIAVWDRETGRERRRFKNVTSQYLPLAFASGQPVLVFGQRDEMVVHANVETGEILFQRVLFPDGEWLAWNPAKAFYMASPQGHEHARLRLADQLRPVYPLELYRDELSRPTNLLAALAGPAPRLAPKNIRLWWHWYPHKKAWLYGAFTALAALTAWGLWRGVIAERRRRTQEVFARRLLQSQEEERKRIAGELHDSLGQNLQIIKNRAVMGLHRTEAPAELETHLREIAGGATRAIAEVRAITHALRPAELDHAGLTSAIGWLAEEVAQSSGLKIDQDIEIVDGLLAAEDEVNLYRIVQEALNNVVKHAAATAVTLELKRTGSMLTLSIFDNGRGFAPAARPRSAAASKGGLGLPGMRERARLLGGHAEVQSSEGRGTRLTVTIKIPEGTAST